MILSIGLALIILFHKFLQILSMYFNDYYVETLLRRQIQKSNTAEQISRQAQIIDHMRGNNSFVNVFFENHNIRYSAKQLEYLETRTALFLLNLFTDVYRNLSRPKIITSIARSKSKVCELPTLGIQAEVKVLSMAWNTTHPPQMNRFCDLEECTNSCDVLACGHAYHHECFLLQLGSQCQYCTAYIVSGIEYNCSKLLVRLMCLQMSMQMS